MARVTMRVERKSTGVLEKVAKMFGRRDPNRVKVGFPAGTDSHVLKVAIFNHFGTRGSGKPFKTPRGGGFGGPIPERPFISAAIRDNRNKYTRAMSDSAPKILRAETNIPAVLTKLGIMAVGDIQSSILSWTTPPNSPTTVRLKGTNAPLRDTGRLHSSVWHKLD